MFKWFTRKPVIEVASVRFNKLDKWVQLQYKPILELTMTRLRTNIESAQSYVSELEKNLKAFEQRIIIHETHHVQTQLQNYQKHYLEVGKKILVRLDAPVSTDDLHAMHEYYVALNAVMRQTEEVRTRVGPGLSANATNLFEPVRQIIQRIASNIEQANDIMSSAEYRSYLGLDALVQSYLSKLHKRELIKQKHLQIAQEIEEQTKILIQLRRRVEKIEADPRYLMERESARRPTAKYHKSFYELELLDAKSKFDQQKSKKQELIALMNKLEATEKDLGIPNALQMLKQKIFEKFSIEVDIVENDPTDTSTTATNIFG